MDIQTGLAIVDFTYGLLAVKVHASNRRWFHLGRRFVRIHFVAIQDLKRALLDILIPGRVVELAAEEFLEGRLLALILSLQLFPLLPLFALFLSLESLLLLFLLG